jgi:hypothetical protein
MPAVLKCQKVANPDIDQEDYGNRYCGYRSWLPITPTEYFTMVYSLFTHCHIMSSYANNNEKDRGKIWGDEGIPHVALLYTLTNRKRN